MADHALQRKNMVESQVRPSDVTDRRVMRAMQEVPREAFVPLAMKPVAYMDDELRLVSGGAGRTARAMLAPRAFARLLQLAEIESGDVVLDIGCATGYSSAIIARVAETVVALEVDAELAETAATIIEQQRIDNIAVVTGDLDAGYASEGPFDVIVIEGAVADVPPGLLDQLKDGGRLVAITAGVPPRAALWRRSGRTFDRREAFEAAGPHMPGFEAKSEFIF
ncbi:MAG: protein-L-isoaspartate O-methyltransferase [Hyphomicrobiaceae bacterium]